MLKSYKLSFDVWGFLLFLVIMVPNFVWFAFPAPNDVLRADSMTEAIDTAASVCQVLIIALLCMFKNRACGKLRVTPLIVGTISCCLLYFVSWAAYYTGIAAVIVILGLTLPPCFAFLLFAIDRKNGIAIIPIIFFTICHLIYGVVNFII